MYHAQGERKWLSNVGYIFACICGQKSETLSLDRWPLSIELHAPTVQPKSLSWWGEVGNSLIFQHSPSREGSLRPQTWNRSEQQLFYLIALTRIRTRDIWLWYHIELHAPTSSTQKLKLMERGGQFTYIPTLNSSNISALGSIITFTFKYLLQWYFF
jgi:hypothetical protein